MFDIELAIRQWREQMLSAGIKRPDLLSELESHLREDIEREPLSNADALANAPLAGQGYFKVPKVIER